MAQLVYLLLAKTDAACIDPDVAARQTSRDGLHGWQPLQCPELGVGLDIDRIKRTARPVTMADADSVQTCVWSR